MLWTQNGVYGINVFTVQKQERTECIKEWVSKQANEKPIVKEAWELYEKQQKGQQQQQ